MPQAADALHGNESEGRAPLWRSALKVVIPRRAAGQLRRRQDFPGIAASASTGAIMYS